LESINSFKASNLLKANRLTNTQSGVQMKTHKKVTEHISNTCVNSSYP